MTHTRNSLMSSRVLELGSGVGFLGIIIAQLQIGSPSLNPNDDIPKMSRVSLYLTDSNAQVLSRCKNNINLPCNGLLSHKSLRLSRLDWTDAQDDNRLPGMLDLLHEIDADLIIGADLIYDLEVIPALIAVLKLALQIPTPNLSHHKKKAIIAATIRNEKTLATFISQARDAGLDVDEQEIIQSTVFS
ncbi:hypothetical protein EW145_g6969, partial [Phellinidium pouzarii]